MTDDHAGRALGESTIPPKRAAVGCGEVRIVANDDCVRLSVYRPRAKRTDQLAEVKWDGSRFDALLVLPWPPTAPAGQRRGNPAYTVVRNGKEWFTVVDHGHDDDASLLGKVCGACAAVIQLGRSMLLPIGGQG